VKNGINNISIAEATYLLSARLTAFRWHELYSGLFTELGNLYANAKGNAQWNQSRGKIPILHAGAD
jgi:hypothetical protein